MCMGMVMQILVGARPSRSTVFRMLLYITAQDRAPTVRKPEICAPVTVFLPAYTGAQQRAAGSAAAGVCGARGEGMHCVGASSGGCGPVQHAGDAGQAGAHLPSGTRHAGTRRPGPPPQVRISPLWLSGGALSAVLTCWASCCLVFMDCFI